MNGQPNDTLRQAASDLSSAVTRGDLAKLQHLAAGGTDLSFIGPLAAAYRGSKIEVVGFDSDSGGEADATFRVRCPSGRTVSFQAGFIFDAKDGRLPWVWLSRSPRTTTEAQRYPTRPRSTPGRHLSTPGRAGLRRRPTTRCAASRAQLRIGHTGPKPWVGGGGNRPAHQRPATTSSNHRRSKQL